MYSVIAHARIMLAGQVIWNYVVNVYVRQLKFLGNRNVTYCRSKLNQWHGSLRS